MMIGMMMTMMLVRRRRQEEDAKAEEKEEAGWWGGEEERGGLDGKADEHSKSWTAKRAPSRAELMRHRGSQ